MRSEVFIRLVSRAVLSCVVVIATSVVSRVQAEDLKITHTVANGKVRQWSDVSGKYKTNGRLIGYGSKYVCILKETGKQTTVPYARLCAADQHHVRTLVADKKHVKPLHTFVSSAGKPTTPHAYPKLAAPVTTQDTIRVRVKGSVLYGFVRRSEPLVDRVSDYIVGYPVSGSSRTDTHVSCQLVPSYDTIQLAIPISGQISAQVVSNADVVRIHTRTSGNFTKQLMLTLTPDFVDISPQPTRISLNSQIVNVSTDLPRLRGRIARRVGGRRAEEMKPQAERETAMKNRSRIDAATQKRVDQMLDRISEFASSLDETLKDIQNDYAARTHMSTTSDAVHIRIRQQLEDEDAAEWTEPPAASAPVVIQVHQAAIQEILEELGEMDDPEALAERLMSNEGPAAKRLRTVIENGRREAKWSDDDQWFTIRWYPQ